MIAVSVKLHLVRKRKAVYLSKDLPLGFYNKKPIPAGTKGYVASEGFERGILRVHFPLWAGDENAQFNALSAEKYLECDPYL